MTRKLYYCSHCRKSVKDVKNLLFVEEESSRGFCTENCIIQFYTPYMEVMGEEELANRETCGLMSSEGKDHLYQNKELFEKALYSPDEVWVEQSELREEYFTHIYNFKKDGTNFYFILICSYYEGEPSFVFFKTITKSAELVDLYRKDKPGEDELNNKKNKDISVSESSASDNDSEVESLDEISLPVEVVEDIELKKSQVLAELLERRKESDIKFEDFMIYDEYISLSIDDPDEIYETEDDAGDTISTNIKSFQKGDLSFFYIVICTKIEIPGNLDQLVLVPILTFPSVDNDLYKFYAVGERTHGKLRN